MRASLPTSRKRTRKRTSAQWDSSSKENKVVFILVLSTWKSDLDCRTSETQLGGHFSWFLWKSVLEESNTESAWCDAPFTHWEWFVPNCFPVGCEPAWVTRTVLVIAFCSSCAKTPHPAGTRAEEHRPVATDQTTREPSRLGTQFFDELDLSVLVLSSHLHDLFLFDQLARNTCDVRQLGHWKKTALQDLVVRWSPLTTGQNKHWSKTMTLNFFRTFCKCGLGLPFQNDEMIIPQIEFVNLSQGDNLFLCLVRTHAQHQIDLNRIHQTTKRGKCNDSFCLKFRKSTQAGQIYISKLNHRDRHGIGEARFWWAFPEVGSMSGTWETSKLK